MTFKRRSSAPDLEPDPFGERATSHGRRVLQLMGARFRFESNSPDLLRLVNEAYSKLPAHRLSPRLPQYRVQLILAPPVRLTGTAKRPGRRRPQPPTIPMLHGAGFLGSSTNGSTFVVLSPAQRSALIFVSREMLRFPYHIRYEMIEFAVFTLASRAQGLVPLHAACVGRKGRGILIMGPSGAGKSTVSLQCLLEGFDFLSEDSVFVAPVSMRATGIANFLHVRADSLKSLPPAVRALIRSSPTIRRRSGVKKFEVDLRRKPFELAQDALKIVGVAFLSERRAPAGRVMRRLTAADTTARLMREQAYGATLKQWRRFSRNISKSGVEILRGSHPSTSVEALRSLLQRKITKPRRSPG